MEILNVIVAAVAAYGFGAAWYMTLSAKWVAVSSVPTDNEGDPINKSDPKPYITAFICCVIVAGMVRHMYSLSGIDTLSKGLTAGLGIGLFLATPWLVTCYAFAGRPKLLMVIDGGYATFGCAIIGVILTLF